MLFWLPGRRGGKQLFLESVLVAYTFRRKRRVCFNVSKFFRWMKSAETHLVTPCYYDWREHTCDLHVHVCPDAYSLTNVGGVADDSMHISEFLT